MLNLLLSTQVNRRIPKQKFYGNLDVSPEMKRIFIEEISVIYWRNKLCDSTMNIAPGERVTELEVFEIKLNYPLLDERALKLIDKGLPYHIMYVLTYDDKRQLWIGYKEAAQGGSASFKVNRYFHTEWLPPERLSLKLEGLNLDAVYEGFVRQIAPGEVGVWSVELGKRLRDMSGR